MHLIPYGRQTISQQDVDAVVEALGAEFLTQGPLVKKFEAAVVQYCGAAFGIAMNSATSALHLACLALDLGPGDVLWTSPNTFVASANCARYCGADVDFVDIDPHSYNMSVAALAAKLEQAESKGTLPKIVVPVHFAGQSCDMRAIKALADQYDFHIIEDASHAIGGKYLGDAVGNGHYSDITVFSFHPVKIITTGEGGMALTNHAGLAGKLQLLRSHGITRQADQMTVTPEGPWYYQQIELGFNFRMTDIQAALGLSQLQQLDAFIKQRHQIAACYERLLTDLPIILPWQHSATHSAFHLYVIRLKLKEVNYTRRQVFDAMQAAGIGVNVHYIPVHTQPYYQQMGFNIGDFPEAEKYCGIL